MSPHPPTTAYSDVMFVATRSGIQGAPNKSDSRWSSAPAVWVSQQCTRHQYTARAGGAGQFCVQYSTASILRNCVLHTVYWRTMFTAYCVQNPRGQTYCAELQLHRHLHRGCRPVSEWGEVVCCRKPPRGGTESTRAAPSICDDVISRAHVSRKREQQAAASSSHGH